MIAPPRAARVTPIEPEEVRAVLDDVIRSWRAVRDHATSPSREAMGQHYVDAYQRIRFALLGETLAGGGVEDDRLT